MLSTFTAIDFETANGKRSSICQIGLVRVEDGIITKKLSVLVQPPDNYYWSNFTEIHGITPKHTEHTSTFDGVWQQIEPFISNQNLVAHNGFGFDFQCLKQTLTYYNLPIPDFTGHCTYKIYKKKLNLLCQQYDIVLNHHDALSDANACAALFLRHLNS